MPDDPKTHPATDIIGEQRPKVSGCLLEVIAGPDRGKQVEVRGEAVVVGAASACDLQLNDGAVSGRHLRIAIGERGIEVEDLGSTNGTHYLETRISRIVVHPGAVLRLGRTELMVAPPSASTGIPTSERDHYGDLLGGSAAMRRLYATLERLEPVDYPVLILGETGVGKELVARELHRASGRGDRPYEIFDCGGVAPNLVESELFGHVKGAFTGAQGERKGIFERGHGGTVFIDEIGELPLELQPKLLRVLESQTVMPVGGSKRVTVYFRLVAATNRDLSAEVEAGRFREDLFFRINVISLTVPPLRERRGDIPALVRAFLDGSGLTQMQLSPQTIELFTSSYDWPGNVRELRNAIARVVVSGEPTDPSQLAGGAPRSAADPGLGVDIDQPLSQAKRRLVEAFEREYLVSQLERSGGNIGQAARASQMDRSQFKRLLKRHGLLGSAGEE